MGIKKGKDLLRNYLTEISENKILARKPQNTPTTIYARIVHIAKAQSTSDNFAKPNRTFRRNIFACKDTHQP